MTNGLIAYNVFEIAMEPNKNKTTGAEMAKRKGIEKVGDVFESIKDLEARGERIVESVGGQSKALNKSNSISKKKVLARNGTIYVEDIRSIKTTSPKIASKHNIDERAVDAICKENLVSAGFASDLVVFGKTGLPSIDNAVPSKSVRTETTKGGEKKGKFDVGVMSADLDHSNCSLFVLVEDKPPTINVDDALEEAIYYCNGLRSKDQNIRIAVGFNGLSVKWRVATTNSDGQTKWEPFFIDGKECVAFPTPQLVSMIYAHENCHAVAEDRSESSKRDLLACINNIRQKFRQISFIGNNNRLSLDFTIAFISLKSILEKHGSLIPQGGWLSIGFVPAEEKEKNDKDVKAKNNIKLQDNIRNCIEYICDSEGRSKDSETLRGSIDLAKQFRDVFIQKDKQGAYDFNFIELIKSFRSADELTTLRFIYDQISTLPPLHSSRIDLFGETYELLADKRTKKMFGEYFTGRHIIKPLIELLFDGLSSQYFTGEIKNHIATNPKKICDPACGTGGFLTEAFKYMSGILAGVDVNNLASRAIYGYDIFSSNVTKTKINLYLAGDGFSELATKNSLTELSNNMFGIHEGMERQPLTEYFDFIITNPPYGKGDYCVLPAVSKSKRLEVNFLIRIIQLLAKGGKALIILPDGVLESPSLAPVRNWMLRNCKIDKVIGLPKFAFAPYTKEKTYALFLTKRDEPLADVEKTTKQKEKVWFYIVDNDGLANSDKRFPTNRKNEEGRWLHDELSAWVDGKEEEHECALIERWRKEEQDDNEEFFDEWGNQIEGKKFGYVFIKTILEAETGKVETVSNKNVLGVIRKILIPNFDEIAVDEWGKYGITISNNKNGQPIYTLATNNGPLVVKKKEARSHVINSLEEGILPTKVADLFDSEGAFKEEYETLLREHECQIEWSPEDESFVKTDGGITEKLINLVPEKYLRAKSFEPISIGAFDMEVAAIEQEFRKMLATLSDNERGRS